MKATVPSPPPETCTETEFQAWVIKVLVAREWLYSHSYRGKVGKGAWRTNTTPGVPDLMAVRAGRLLFVELKARTGRTSDTQEQWLDALAEVVCAEVYVWQPADWRDVIAALT